MKIVVDSNIPFCKETFGTLGDVTILDGRKITAAAVKDADILIVRSVTIVDRQLLEGSAVKFVGTATIGYDHVDTAWLAEQCIGFASAPGSNAISVAEYVVSALFELSRQKKFPLAGKKLGVIGVGNVGSAVLRFASALGMETLLCDPPKKRLTGSELFLPLEQVLAAADIVTVHVPLTMDGSDVTHHLVNAQFLESLKKGAMLINTSRGKVVDEHALRVWAAKKLGGIVLDVWDGEPAISADTLGITHIATPHIAGYSYDGKLKGVEMIYKAVCAFFFKASPWSVGQYYETEKLVEIDIGPMQDPVGGAVMAAYNIAEDHKKLKKISEKEAAQHGDYFDTLRKKYPVRREFSRHLLTSTTACPVADKNILKQLGFNM